MANTGTYFTAFETYKRYICIRNHFDCNNSYDFIKYNGKAKNLKEESFRKRKDSHFFFKLSRKIPAKKMLYFLIANFSVRNFPWIGELIDSESYDIYVNWLNRIENLEAHFEYQFDRLLEKAKKENDSELFTTRKNLIPNVFSHYENEIISLETLCILDECLNIVGKTKKTDEKNVIQFTNFPAIECKIESYKKFINIERNKYIQIIRNKTRGT